MKLPTLIFAALAGVTTMAAAQAPNPLYLGRIGLFSDPIYTDGGPSGTTYTQQGDYDDLTDTGFAVGRSYRYSAGQYIGADVWAANTLSGVTHKIGLFPPSAVITGEFGDITESALVTGNTNVLLIPGPPNPRYAYQTWVADAITGVTVRTGLYSAEFTGTSGIQQSNNLGITESGLVYGTSERYNGNAFHGRATWMTNTDNGVTSRIGFFGPDHTRADNSQESTIVGVSDLEYVVGNSLRYSGSDPSGSNAWAAARINGTTYPIGLYQPPTYLSTDGRGGSSAYGITKSGYAFGNSARFAGNIDIGSAAWVHNLSNNTVKRLGLTGVGYMLSFTGYENSFAYAASESGFIGGMSYRFAGAVPTGQAAWVANFTDGISVRAGLTAAEFTKSTGYQISSLGGVTEQGNGYGFSERYIGDEMKGKATWVFNKSTGTTTRVGLFDAVHTSADGTQNSEFQRYIPASTAGWAPGYSDISANVQSHWVASTSSGTTTAVGLTGPDFTGPGGVQNTTLIGFTSTSYAYGTSQRFAGGGPDNQGVWGANFNTTGTTVRLGLFGTPEYTLADGSEYSQIHGITKSGYVWGVSGRAEASGGGGVSWVYNLNTGTQQTFKIQVAPNGQTRTLIQNVTENGLVSGYFHNYDPTTSAYLGFKHFVWSPAKGTKILADQFGTALPTNNWTSIFQFRMNKHGLIIAKGDRGINTAANPGGNGVFRAYFAP